MTITKALFLGSKTFGLEIFKTLRQSQPDIVWTVLHPDDKNDDRSVLSEFSSFCDTHNIPTTVVNTPKTALEAIDGTEFDIAFVCGWYWLLPEKTLFKTSAKFFGIHNSLLPKYRGGAPLVWSILNGEPVVGSSLFQILPGMDDGPIALKIEHTLTDTDTIETVLSSIEAQYLNELKPVWPRICSQTQPLEIQDESQATYCGQRKPEDGLIDWSKTASELHNFIRAQSHPYPGAFTMHQDEKLTIVSAQPFDAEYFNTPGQILQRAKNYIVIGCGHNTALKILAAKDTKNNTKLMSLFPSISVRLQ